MNTQESTLAETLNEESARLASQVAGVRTPLAQSGAAISEVLTTLRESAAFLGQLGARASDIGKISLLIEHIASESRLLALNAKILSAQAGAAGAGFRIVAEKMMALADHTRDSATGIQEALDSLKRETEQAGARVSDGAAQVQAAVTLSDTASDGLNAIYETTKRISRAVRSAPG